MVDELSKKKQKENIKQSLKVKMENKKILFKMYVMKQNLKRNYICGNKIEQS